MSEEQLHRELTQRLAGLSVAAAEMLSRIEAPGMTAARLRQSREMIFFRQEIRQCSRWMIAAANHQKVTHQDVT